MIEIVFFGRGGQGAVTAAQVLATAAFRAGMYAQAFPSFGPERRGAPVTAYARIDQRQIADRGLIFKADYVIVLDPNVMKTTDPLNSVKEGGCAIVNTDRPKNDVIREARDEAIGVHCINASAISEQVYGKKAIPITNIAMLGAFSYISHVVELNNILVSIEEFFSGERAEEAKTTARIGYGVMAGEKSNESASIRA
jgi:2-oxoisovalerate ferredoxin oxidoreductase gamma subunit